MECSNCVPSWVHAVHGFMCSKLSPVSGKHFVTWCKSPVTIGSATVPPYCHSLALRLKSEVLVKGRLDKGSDAGRVVRGVGFSGNVVNGKVEFLESQQPVLVLGSGAVAR